MSTTQGTEHHTWIPSTQDGKIDWNTLGNTLTAAVLGEVLEVSYLDSKHAGKKGRGDILTDWRYGYEENNISVFTKKKEDASLCCFMGRGVIDVPVVEVAEFLNTQYGLFIDSKHVLCAKYVRPILNTKTKKDLIGYLLLQQKFLFFQGTGDLCYYCRKVFMEDGKFLVTVMSVECAECPQIQEVPRMKIFKGSGWLLEPYNGDQSRTLASYVMHVDTGTIPAMVVQRAMKAQVRQIHKLRQRLVKPQRGKNASSYTSSPPGAGDGSIVVPYRDSTVPYEDALPMVEFTRYTHDDCCH
eukprot:Em0019g1148a